MKTILYLLRDFVLGQAILHLLAILFATPLVLYVFVFSKFTPNWAAGIVIILLIMGFTASLDKFTKSGDMNNTDIKKFTKAQLLQSKITAENWAKEKVVELDTLQRHFTDEEYSQKLEIIQDKLNTRLRLIDDELESRINIIGISIFGVIILFIFWLQPWERPIEKIQDEWRTCNNKYDGQCSFIGNKYKTNTFEMAISEAFHGEYDDKECSRSRYNERC